MFRNYFKIAVRSLLKHKKQSMINILGLSVGLASCLLIAVYVFAELSYDSFHAKADRIVRVTMEIGMDGNVQKAPVTGTKVAPAFKRDFPEVEKAVRVFNMTTVVRNGDKFYEEKGFYYADSSFFDIFSFKLLEGNPSKALAAPNQVVLTTSSAKKYFGNQSALGKTLRINDSKDYTVTGVVEDAPANSQMKFDMIGSFMGTRAAQEEQWYSANYITYLLLNDKDAIAGLQAKIPGYMKSKADETFMQGNNYLSYNLEPIKEVHLYSKESGFEPNNDIRYIYIFSFIALLILVIACTNYMNMATARASERAREVGVRKVMGALKLQLFWQFMGEALIITSIAMLFSLLLAELMLPMFNEMTGQQLSLKLLAQPVSIFALISVVVLISLLAGSYPAFALSSFTPVRVLKGNFSTSYDGLWLRKGLIIIQFAISTFLIVSAITVQTQLSYIQDKKLGYNKDQVIVLPADEKIFNNLQAFKNELKNNSNILEVTGAYETPTDVKGSYGIKSEIMPEGQHIATKAMPVDKDFIKAFDLELIAGEDYNDTDEKLALQPGDEAVVPFILNEKLAAELGWTPEEAVGKKARMASRKGIVKGVVKDFHFASMHEEVGPLVLFIEELSYGTMVVKVSGNDITGTINFMKDKWGTLAPHRPFDYKFLDEEFDQLYAAEYRTAKVFGSFAVLAIVLACMGLFGLAAYTAMQRTKEIGIRKVLGASITNIIGLLSGDFLKLVAISVIVAVPLAWYAMSRWLEDFAYRIDISIWVFVLAAIVALLIAFITVSFQAFKAAIANPVKSLRSE